MLANIITRALGMDQVTVDITIEDLQPGDLYLLCSDGLCDMLTDEDMLRIVLAAPNLDAAALALVDQANENGGNDNITVALIKAVA
jgi:protein phosphatase